MENNRKLLFFDIDKTLLTPYPWTVPDSAKQALKEARYNGHLLFINSGRTYTMIPEIIKEMGFDGYVCGCGSQIYMNEELLFSSSIPNPLCRKTTELLRECRIPAFFERPDKILYDSSSCAVPETVQKLKAGASSYFLWQTRNSPPPVAGYRLDNTVSITYLLSFWKYKQFLEVYKIILGLFEYIILKSSSGIGRVSVQKLQF